MDGKIYTTCSQFDIVGIPESIERYGCGHINDTYLVVCNDNGKQIKYILQKINTNVFKDSDALISNISNVTEYIKNVSDSSQEEILKLIPTKNGEKYYKDADGGCYRIYNFIDGAISIETSPTLTQLEVCGVGFGRFQNLLDGFPAEKLFETIKDFHNTKRRFLNFEQAIKSDVKKRKASVQKEIDFYYSRAHYASVIVDMLANGKIPTRVTHNDTKMNNLLIDTVNMRAVTVIDLDTIMPGSILYDFGDTIRSGANIGAEDEQDLSKVGFSLEMFEAFSRGFLSEVGKKLNDKEIEYLAFGAILMTYECGMRFLTDYLNGDIYFKTKYPTHNLVRTRTQMKMVEDMEKELDNMNAIVKKYARPVLEISREKKTAELSDNISQKTPLNKTIVEYCSDNEGLKFNFDVKDDSIISFGSKYNEPLYKGDVVEIFITLGKDNRYLEIEVNPDGANYAVVVDNKDGMGDISLSPIEACPFTSHTKVVNGGWQTEIVIKYSELNKLGWDISDSKINLYRQDYRPIGELNLYALSPTKRNNFHVVSAFIPLTIKE